MFTHLVFRGKMIPEELEKLVIKHKEEGHLPFFVNCTTGTTVYGAYDPISEIAGESHCHHFTFCFHSLLKSAPPTGCWIIEFEFIRSIREHFSSKQLWEHPQLALIPGDIYSHCTFIFFR